MDELDDNRRAQIVGALAAIRARIADACSAAGRDPHSVTMIAVTKTYPATDVATLVRLGVFDIGENRDQEATAKVGAVADLLATVDAPPPRWHFVGQVQRRKARSIASYAAAVHSVDRLELIDALATAVRRADRPPLDVFVQLSLDGNPERGGVRGDELLTLADAVAADDSLILRGIMAVAPMNADPDEAFAAVEQVAGQLRAEHPQADAISAGMSGDLEQAVRHGATHVRVGTALLGRRTPDVG